MWRNGRVRRAVQYSPRGRGEDDVVRNGRTVQAGGSKEGVHVEGVRVSMGKRH